MDVARTCHTRAMRFFHNSPITCEVRWYRCPPHALVFPGHNVFGNADWASEKFGWSGLGEVDGSTRRWSNGETPPTVTGDKQCGDVSLFETGLTWPPLGPDVPVEYDQFDIPTCCSGAGPPAPPPPPPPSENVRDFQYWRMVATGGMGRWYVGGGMYTRMFSSLGIPSDTIYATPFVSPRGGTLGRLGFWLNNGAPSAKVRCAIYGATSNADVRPSELLVETGEIDASAGAQTWQSIPISIPLDPDQLYWLCILHGGPIAPVVGYILGDTEQCYQIFGFDEDLYNSKGSIAVPFAYGPFPFVFPSVDKTMLVGGSVPAAAVQYSA